MLSPNAIRSTPDPAPARVRASAWGALLALLTITAFGLSAPAALAHASLVSINPADGSTVAAAPTQIVLTFSEDLLATSVRVQVVDGEGVPVADGTPVVDGPVATQPLVDGLSAGGYSVTYRVVSKDGHPVSGSTTFTAQAAAATTPAVPTTPASTPATPQDSPTTGPATTSATSSAATTAAAPDSTSEESGNSGVVVGVVVALAVVGALALAAARRRTGSGRHVG